MIKIVTVFLIACVSINSAFAIPTTKTKNYVQLQLAIEDSLNTAIITNINNKISMCANGQWVELGSQYSDNLITSHKNLNQTEEVSEHKKNIYLILGKLSLINHNKAIINFMLINSGPNPAFIANPKIIASYNKENRLILNQEGHVIKINVRLLTQAKIVKENN